jgi:hypothetical protein
MIGRKIIYECDEAAQKIGGYELIDDSLDTILEPLTRNPRGFPSVDCAWGSVRYARTLPIGDCPALIWYFIMDQRDDVILVHVEHDDIDD